MKRLIVVAMALCALVSIAPAAPVCVDGTMASYKALGAGGCTIGDMLFYSFFHLNTFNPTGQPVPDAAISIKPDISGGPFVYGIILSSEGWTVPSGSPLGNSYVDSTIRFSVSVAGPPLIKAASLDLTGGSVTGTGRATIDETLQPGGYFMHVAVGGASEHEIVFAGVPGVSVTKDLNVFVPINTEGSATITGFAEYFSHPVPEPLGTVLIGSGLVLIGLLSRRQLKRR